jgi:hypothetical protein
VTSLNVSPYLVKGTGEGVCVLVGSGVGVGCWVGVGIGLFTEQDTRKSTKIKISRNILVFTFTTIWINLLLTNRVLEYA